MKKTPWSLKGLVPFLALIAALGVVAVGNISAAGASKAVAQKKSLSQSSVTVLANPCAGDYVDAWIAQKLGYFHQQGLNVTQDLPVGITSSVLFPEFLSGSAQFVVGGLSTFIPARAGGANIIAIAQADAGEVLQVAIQPSVAAAIHLPNASNNVKEVDKQLEALEGQHLKIGLSSATAIGFLVMQPELQKLGITYGFNNSSDNLDMDVTGSVTAMAAAFAADKVDGIIGTETYTYGAWPVINVGLLSQVSDLDLFSSPTFISAHPDTVQAFVNAYVLAWQYTKEHPASANKLVDSLETYCGLPNPQQQVYLNQALLTTEPTPALPKSVWTKTLAQYNAGFEQAGQPKDTLTFTQANDPKFVNNAITKYHVKQPNWKE